VGNANDCARCDDIDQCEKVKGIDVDLLETMKGGTESNWLIAGGWPHLVTMSGHNAEFAQGGTVTHALIIVL